MLFVMQGGEQEREHREIFPSHWLPKGHSLRSWPPPWRRPQLLWLGVGPQHGLPTPTPQPHMLRTPSVFSQFPPRSPTCTESKRILDRGLRFSVTSTHSPAQNPRFPGREPGGASAPRPPSPSGLVLPSPRVPLLKFGPP